MDYVQRLQAIATKYQAAPLLTEIPDIIFSQQDIGFSHDQKQHKSGFCNLCAFWLALRCDLWLFSKSVYNINSPHSIIRYMVSRGQSSSVVQAFSYAQEVTEGFLSNARQLKQYGLPCLPVEGFREVICDELGLLTIERQQY